MITLLFTTQVRSFFETHKRKTHAATKLNKKIRWCGDRTDEFVGGTHGRDLTSTASFALDEKGKVLAYRVKSIGCTGIILTKLDGTAKGGVVVAVRQAMDLPVKFIGVGEGLDDLQPFDADTFVESLFA